MRDFVRGYTKATKEKVRNVKMGNQLDEMKQSDKLINRFLLRGNKFVDYACFQYGAYNMAISGKANASYISDFQYFVFVKSTKSLRSIRTLLDMGNVEDVFILLRTMFEGYLASRFIDENYDDHLLGDFIFIPQQIARRKIIYQNEKAINRETKELVEYIQRNPSQMKLGKDRSYFCDFYAYLCNYAHCNFSIIPCYLNDMGMFSLNERINEYMARVLVLFVYTRIFESIVTVEGEDFLDLREENECYQLVRDANKFLYDKLTYFSTYESKDANKELNRHMKNMFKAMKKSLKEEIGSVKKDFLNN